MPARRLTSLLAVVLLTLAGVLAPALAPALAPGSDGLEFGAPAALAARAPATVAVDSLEPAVLTPGATLGVAGRVTNTGTGGLRNVEIRLRLSSTRLGSRTELAAVADGRTTSRDGAVILSRGLRDLGAGETATFDLRQPVNKLSALTGFGVYVLGVEVLASRDSGFGRVAIQRTLLPWVPTEQVLVPTGFSWLWPLVARPTRLADGTFADDSLAPEIGPEGRLTRLLTAGTRLGTGAALTWAIDPELVAAVTDMANGYQVRGPDGLVDGGGAPLALRWLEDLRVATARSSVIPLPYGDVDLTAAVRADLGRDVTRALELGRTTLASALPAADVLVGTAWPIDGYASKSTLAALRRSDIASVVLDSRALPAAIDLSYTPTGRAHVPTRSGRLAGLLSDAGLTDLLGAPAGTSLVRAQRLLAETAMIASELPSGPARTIVVAPPRRWDPDPAFLDRLIGVATSAPWMDPAPLTELAGQPPPEVDRTTVRYPKAQLRAELPASYLSAVSDMHDGVSLFSAILTDRSQYIPAFQRSLLLLESTWWRGRESRANRLARDRGYLSDLRGEVRVQPGNFTFSSRRGTIALTISNGLEQPVVVNLRLDPQTARLRLEPTEVQTIGPRSKAQVEVAATAVAPGGVLVRAGLHTVGGPAYGQPVRLRITITEYGTVALYITIGAAAVLFLAAGIRVLRRLRGARGGAGPQTPEESGRPAAEVVP